MSRALLALLAAILVAGVAALAIFLIGGGEEAASGDRVVRPGAPAADRGVARPGDALTASSPEEQADPGAPEPPAGGRGLVGRAPDAAPATRQVLLGHVLHAGRPLQGAHVRYTTRDGEMLAEADTDARGAFEIPAPRPLEDGRIHVDARGFAPLSTGPHAIRAGERRFVGNLQIERGVPLSGLVTGPSGTAIAEASVELTVAPGDGSPNQHVQRATADAQGRFRFPDAPLGQLRLVARAPGHGARALEVLHQDDGAPVTVALLPERALSVRVRDQHGAPVPDADVRLLPHSPLAGEARARTGADGIARLDGLGAELFDLRVDAAGHRAGMRDRVPADGGLVEIELSRWPCIRGRVTVAGGEPAPTGTLVALLSADARGLWFEAGPAPQPVGADGGFALCDLRPGVYAVEARAPGWAPTRSSERRIALGADAEGVRIELAAGASVELVVQTGTDPLRGARVEVWTRPPPPTELYRTPATPPAPPTVRPLASGTTDAEGRVRFEHLAPGDVWLLAIAPDLVPGVLGPVTVRATGVQRAGALRLEPGGRIRGRLVGLTAGAREGVVNVFSEGGTTGGVPVLVPAQADGSFQTPVLPPGAYRLTARISGVAGEPTRTGGARATVERGKAVEVELQLE